LHAPLKRILIEPREAVFSRVDEANLELNGIVAQRDFSRLLEDAQSGAA